MKSALIIAFLLFLVSCSEEGQNTKNCEGANLEECRIVDESNLRTLSEKCDKLAACIGGTAEVLHFSNQSHNPYACSVKKKGKTREKEAYFYPRAELSFGEVSFAGLDNEIQTCELMTETGDKSDKYIDDMNEAFKQMQEDRARREKEEAEYRKPLPPVKIRVVQ